MQVNLARPSPSATFRPHSHATRISRTLCVCTCTECHTPRMRAVFSRGESISWHLAPRFRPLPRAPAPLPSPALLLAPPPAAAACLTILRSRLASGLDEATGVCPPRFRVCVTCARAHACTRASNTECERSGAVCSCTRRFSIPQTRQRPCLDAAALRRRRRVVALPPAAPPATAGWTAVQHPRPSGALRSR